MTGHRAEPTVPDPSTKRSNPKQSGSDSNNNKAYFGPFFFYDTGDTGSFASLDTPITKTKNTSRRIGGIGGVIITAHKKGVCHAIPNVAVSDGIHRNLAGVSQLARHHNTSLTFTKDKVYGIRPKHLPMDKAVYIGEAVLHGLYRMNMN